MRRSHHLGGIAAGLSLALLPLAPLMAQEHDPAQHGMAIGSPTIEARVKGAENHRASGTVHITAGGQKGQLHFTPDFSVEKGPDVYITLANGPRPMAGSVVVARLTKFSGEQTFDLPANTDVSRFSHLVLWCRKYSVAMAVAQLPPAAEKMEMTEGAMSKEDGAAKAQRP